VPSPHCSVETVLEIGVMIGRPEPVAQLLAPHQLTRMLEQRLQDFDGWSGT
jgi:hypothetical protein